MHFGHFKEVPWRNFSIYFIFGVIVVVHEFGHFYFAKKAGTL